MLRFFRRAITKSAGRAASANLRVVADAVETLTGNSAKPEARKRPATKPRMRKVVPPKEPRKGLAETVTWIAAGGMPAVPHAARQKVAVPRGASFSLASFSSDHGERWRRCCAPA